MVPGTVLDLETLRKMLVRECELRLSLETQDYMNRLEKEPWFDREHGDWIDYVGTLQKRVLIEFGFGENDILALGQLRSATRIYPELSSIPHYIKYNRARRGELKVGDLAPDVKLHVLNNDHELTETSLHQIIRNDRSLVICAVSWS